MVSRFQPSEPELDATSVALFATWIGLGVYTYFKPSKASAAAFGAATIGFIGYDRKHDGLWPFKANAVTARDY